MLSRLLNWRPAPPAPPLGGGALDLPTGRPTVIPASLPTARVTAFSADTFQPSSQLEAIRQDAQRLMNALPAVGASTPVAPPPTPAAPPPFTPVAPSSSTPDVVDFTTPGLTEVLASLHALPPGVLPVAPASRPTTLNAPYINQYHPNGEAQGYTNGGSNCGPTSMAMIARAFGYGAGLSDAKLINHLGSAGGTTEDGTSVGGIAKMAQAIGKSAEIKGPGPNTAWIADQLRAGKLVVANGDYYAMGNHNRAKIGSGGHYVAVIGLDANGNFLVDDPADSSIRGRAFTPEELAVFIKSNNNGGYQIAVG